MTSGPSKIESLDPRVSRLPGTLTQHDLSRKPAFDQFTTFEVFVQPKQGKAFQHEGIVHAPDLEMAYLFAKEGFTRRFLCTSLSVVPTGCVTASPMTEGSDSAFDRLDAKNEVEKESQSFEIFVLTKRGKQHVHAATVSATGPFAAMAQARSQWMDKPVCNVWAIPTSDFRFTNAGDSDLWLTLPEKKFRDAGDYKGGDKLKQFLEKNKKVNV